MLFNFSTTYSYISYLIYMSLNLSINAALKKSTSQHTVRGHGFHFTWAYKRISFETSIVFTR